MDPELRSAVNQKDYDRVKTLIQQGADVFIHDRYGSNIFNEALHKAIGGDSKLLNVLFESGTDINHKNDNLNSCLHLLISDGFGICDHTNIVKYLISFGADVNSLNFELKTPLHVACEYYWKQPGLVALLLDNNAHPNAQDVFGYTALHRLCRKRNIAQPLWTECCKSLLAHGANPNLKNRDGHTVLHIAIIRGHKESISFLLEYGADPHIKNNEGITGLEVATGEMKQIILDYLSMDIKEPGMN